MKFYDAVLMLLSNSRITGQDSLINFRDSVLKGFKAWVKSEFGSYGNISR